MKFEFVDCDNLLDSFAPPRQEYIDFRPNEDLSFLDYPEPQPQQMNGMFMQENDYGMNMINPMTLNAGVVPPMQQQNMLTPPYLSASASDNTSPESVGRDLGSPVSDVSSPERIVKRHPGSREQNGSSMASSSSAASSGGKVMKPKKGRSSHNMIEKKYRTNINDKISALRDCVPALRCALKGTKDDDELDGLTPASKLNKATVLSKATEYIKHLKTKNEEMQAELDELRRLSGRPAQSSPLSGHSSPGLMQQPVGYYEREERQRERMWEGGRMQTQQQQQQQQQMPQQMQPMHQQSQMQRQPQQQQRSTKAMMGVMAGVMATGLMSEYGDSRELSFIPVPLLRYVPADSVRHSLMLIKLTVIIGSICMIVFPLLFQKMPPPSNKQVEATSVEQFRRQTWEVNAKFMSLPSNGASYLVELTKSVTKAFLRFLIGDGFLLLQSSAYHLPMSRAVEAQLLGGQQDLTRSSLILTYLQSLTLPSTPALCATQAIHVHVIANGLPWLKAVSVFLADRHWNSARKLLSKKHHRVGLPTYLPLLLQQNDVFDYDTIQRFFNFAHNVNVSHNCSLGMLDEGFAAIPGDSSLKTPLDVLASWYSARNLREVILFQMEANEVDYNKLDVSLAVSPPNSIAKRRAAIAHAVVLGRKDSSLVSDAIQLVRAEVGDLKVEAVVEVPATIQEAVVDVEDEDEDEEEDDEEDEELSDSTISDAEEEEVSAPFKAVKMKPTNVVSTAPVPVARDSQIAIHSAFVLCYLSEGETTKATDLLQRLRIRSVDEFGLLSFFSVWQLFSQLQERPAHMTNDTERRLEELVAATRVWLGSEKAELEGISLHRRRSLVNKCVKMGMEFGGFEDEGYASSQ